MSLQDDYDTYLFWPSLNNRGNSPREPASSPLYGPISPDSEATDYDSLLGSGPSSPVMFAPVLGYQSPLPVEMAIDLGSAPEEPKEESNNGAEVQTRSPPTKYSTIVRMGLFFSQMTHRFDHAVEGVKLKLRKPKASEP